MRNRKSARVSSMCSPSKRIGWGYSSELSGSPERPPSGRDCRGSIKQTNPSVWEQISIFCPRFERRSGPYQSCRPVCSIALIQAKLKEFFDRAGATDCLFEIRLGISGAYGRAIVNGLFRPRVLFYKGTGQSCPFRHRAIKFESKL